ncbi:MAG: dihydroorotase [Pirellulaceae bacterium]|jgi:dihydroorotase|nr:dihydroorotase [Pirellulaceae bacterium]MDP7020179.1 dihydroorotase [Pirellulaceae bacterium]
MTKLMLQNGRIVDPTQGIDRVANLLIEDGRIGGIDVDSQGLAQIVDVEGMVVAPGLIDVHAELREPGLEEDETIETGTAAALAGGFSSIACIANTDPPLDTQAGVEFVRQKAARADNCHVHVIACVSKGREGRELAELASLTEAGAVGFSDADLPIHNAELLRRALEYCLMLDRPILNHPEVLELAHGGVMHEGMISMVLGLAGIPAEAEDVMTGRDLRLAESTGGRMHLMNISSAGSVELIRRAKSRGVQVTAEVCPHHLSLTDELLRSFEPNCKVNPPLRSQDHVDACIEGLRDGTIDIICSGHAPRAREKKMVELDLAPFGIAGLETALAVAITHLVVPGLLDWGALIEKMSVNPARLLGLADRGTLAVGSPADVTVIDPDAKWTVSPNEFRSKSANSPYANRELTGCAAHVVVDGRLRFSMEKTMVGND